MTPARRILVAITGASGAIYAERLVESLLSLGCERIYLVATANALQIVQHELQIARGNVALSLRALLNGEVDESLRTRVRVFRSDDLFAPIASGSSAPTDMVVVPCSMGTLARITHGISSNLLERSADVMLKQGRKLVLCPRETPLNAIHLENLLALAKLGVAIVPPMPAFYQKPESIDDLINFCVGRILEVLGFEHQLYQRWNARML